MSPTIGLSPPGSGSCLDTSRKSRYRGGTLIAEDVGDLGEHCRRLADLDAYRPSVCAHCGHDRLHVHSRPERHPRGDAFLPVVVTLLQYRCAREGCAATWRILPAFLARHLWHAWRGVERVLRPTSKSASSPPIAARTEGRWRARLATCARVLVAVLAMSGGAIFEAIAKHVGLGGSRGDLLDVYTAATTPASGRRMSSLAGVVHRLERGVRLV